MKFTLESVTSLSTADADESWKILKGSAKFEISHTFCEALGKSRLNLYRCFADLRDQMRSVLRCSKAVQHEHLIDATYFDTAKQEPLEAALFEF